MYASFLIAYFVFRRKAQKVSAGRPIIQVPGWKSFCSSLTVGLFTGALLWTIDIAALFADLTDSMNGICPLLITPDECRDAALDWQMICVGIGWVAAIAFTILIYTTYTEATRTASPSERSYPFLLLSCSHCFSAASWLLCAPLFYPPKLFALVGPHYWVDASAVFAFFAIIAYTFGTALGIMAAVRMYCRRQRWRRASRSGTPVGGAGASTGDFGLEDVST